jgi:hypothetical protein
MRRPLGAHAGRTAAVAWSLVAFSLAWVGGDRAARAALVTNVASGGDKDKVVAVDLDLQWTRYQENGRIFRQFFDSRSQSSYDADELDYERDTNIINFGAHFGLARDFELRLNVPWTVQDVQSWNYARVNGVSVQKTSTIQNNSLNAAGESITPTPLFAVPGTVYRGGIADPSVGFAWGIFNEGRANHLPAEMFPPIQNVASWVLGVDYTIPLGTAMDPSATQPGSPNSASYLPIGTGEHRIDFWTSMSKRLGFIEPFFRMHYTLPIAGGGAYDNCSIVGKDNNHLVMSQNGQNLCRAATVTVTPAGGGAATTEANPWTGKTGLDPPHVGGILFGADFHPLSNGKDGLNIDLSLEFIGDFISKGRTYNELTDELHKLTYTDEYFNVGGRFTVDIRFNKYVHWASFVSVTTYTPHILTSESVGQDLNNDNKVTLPDANNLGPEVNPNYDFRTDQPGRQFGITSVTVVGVSTRVSVDF